MRFEEHEQVIITAALRALSHGDGKRFDDLLWLGLGDRAKDAWEQLESRGLIRDTETISLVRLTERGASALGKLANRVA